MNTYEKRIDTLCEWMHSNHIDAVVIEDAENRRSKNLRYLTGMHSDAVLVVFSDKTTILMPWDIIQAEKTARADKIIAFSEFERNPVKAVSSVCADNLLGGRIELSSQTPYLLYSEISAAMKGFEIVCRADGVAEKLMNMRAVKDKEEINLYKRAGKMTDKLIDALEGGFRDGSIKTETDAAMFVEAESRRLGAEGSSFETLAAGPTRSWGIHCIPAYSAGPIGCAASDGSGGLSIIDCGLNVDGYATDITMTICCGELSDKQHQMVELVSRAHAIGAEAGTIQQVSAKAVASAVDEVFAAAGWTMPHSLGHGIGLDVHEAPTLKNHPIYDQPILPGMIFTIEPGLYDAEAGGVRLENDYLMTEKGAIALTSSRIVMLR
ncbi:MAG: Xaa-Pro peptidase family protein [Spirochaetales bacterium]|uniref:Xaa-Pro peptidase family protein n=1 Tax=Candidatus Thalassospirochaeta sargassi TaxID=3119039 RepID=A0AAJ1MK91_9SPIO|nr:Xaa-Pro peptidase family protein [Spirochaetales bacterium]